MKKIKKKGFTLIEVLMAVLILGLTAVGTMKLAMISQLGLREAKTQHEFLQVVRQTQIALASGKLKDEGESEDVKWKTEIVKLEQQNMPPITWTEATIESKGKKIKIAIPK